MSPPPSLPPPLAGDWSNDYPANDGAWSVGTIWLDWPGHRLALWIEPRHCNALGVMHGGAMATLADSQCLAVRRYAPGGSDHTPTISLDVDYLAPAPVHSWLVVQVTLLRTTRSLVFTQAVISVDDSPVARSTAIYRNAHP
jgi:acyl-coenzyme A thioesterase PaaI-like protein